MTDPNDLDPADLRALDHLRERLAMPRGDLAAIRAILDKTGDYNGTLPDRVQKLVNDWRAGGRALIRISALVMAGENESAADAVDRYVGTTRQQFAGWVKVTGDIDAALTDAGIEPDPRATLAQRVGELARQRDRYCGDLNHVRELLDGAGIAGDTPDAVAMLLQERAELDAIRSPAAPDVAPAGVEMYWLRGRLYIDKARAGDVWANPDGTWSAAKVGGDKINLPDEPTARAVLLALAGQECGRVEFGLREDATVPALRKLKASPLEWVYDDLLIDSTCGPTTWTTEPADVRAWVEHGQAALTVKAAPGV